MYFSVLYCEWPEKKASGNVEPHFKLCLHQLKKKLRLELYRKYWVTSPKTLKRDFVPKLVGIWFALLLSVYVQVSQTESKAGKLKSWSSKPHYSIKYLSGLGCEPLTPLKVWYLDTFWGSWCEWPV